MLQTSRVNNSVVLRILNVKLSEYYLYINANIKGEYQIWISVPSNLFVHEGLKIPEAYSEPSQTSKIEIFAKIVNSK